ncbi:globin [Parasulfuritortus cantonensis]|uniref:Globin n=1 Tax=Parasulfuritortus cantonensis TaxID=2528202 RepID=A0A4R1B2H7_9PROT|nr:globin [Parasulfuritortus cantonensis]TCJ11650.1 globin [Parasulfuritortus cantonensis]
MESCQPHHHHDAEVEAIPDGALRFECMCSAGGSLQAVDEVRWMESHPDLIFPAVPFPSKHVFAATGTDALRGLVRRHHDRLKATVVGALFPDDPRMFAMAVEKAADFVVEACGGPELFTPVHGPMRMRIRHFPVSIDEHAREVWLRELLASFDDVGFPEPVREEYWNWMEPFSIRMITRRTTREQPRRHPYAGAAASLAQATTAVGDA